MSENDKYLNLSRFFVDFDDIVLISRLQFIERWYLPQWETVGSQLIDPQFESL